MAICKLPPADKQLLARKLGRDLIAQCGKRSHYDVADVQAAMRRLDFPEAWDVWALSLFSSPAEFEAYRARRGQDGDYSIMRGSMIEAASGDAGSSEFVHHDLAGKDEAWFAGFLDSLEDDDSHRSEMHATDTDSFEAVSSEPSASMDMPDDGDSAFNAALYPRSYQTPAAYRLWCMVIAFILVVFFAVMIGPIERGGLNAGAAFLAPTLLCVVIAYHAYRALAPVHVELTATSLTVKQFLSTTKSIARKDICRCNTTSGLFGTRVIIQHRDSMMKSFGLDSLNDDDAFWAWFSGIPGTRNH